METHRKNGTIPKVVFGGRALWKQVCKGRASNEEWQNARQNRLYARGDETKGGNPNIKIYYRGGEFTLAVAISHLSKQKGIDSRGRSVMTRAPRVEGKLWLPAKHRLKTWELCQPEPWPEGFTVLYPKALHKFAGEFQVTVQPNGFLHIKIPELAYSRGYRRTYLTGVLAKVVVDIAKALGKPIALEDLDFGKDRFDTDRKFNRMAANFPFRKIIEAVTRRACKEGVGVKPVWPAHTSTIGYWKYMRRYGVIIHHAAALVIARRAIGFKERITGELKQKIKSIKEKLSRKVDSLPGEGKGMTRKVKRLFGRLDGKIPVHNGLTRFQQESFYSVWHDFKQLVLLSRRPRLAGVRTNR